MAGALRRAWHRGVFAGLAAFGCDDSNDPVPEGSGSITLPVPTQSPDAFSLTSVRILARGPTDTAGTAPR